MWLVSQPGSSQVQPKRVGLKIDPYKNIWIFLNPTQTEPFVGRIGPRILTRFDNTRRCKERGRRWKYEVSECTARLLRDECWERVNKKKEKLGFKVFYPTQKVNDIYGF